jgi:DNA-binding CsgD family transcriptional regulator
MDSKTIDEFIKEIRVQYPPFTIIDSSFEELKKTNFNKNECLFVWDARLGNILFAKGFKNLLGFTNSEITLNDFTDQFHINDKPIILKIGQTAVQYSLDHPSSNTEHCLYVSHRIKRSNGDFIKILAKSTPYEIDNKGFITKFLVILSDISFVDTTDIVQYKFIAKGLDAQSFHSQIFAHNESIFTSREKEIIMEIKNGYSSPKIAENLKISVHTVATHRKKIMKKSGCHSSKELLLFCKKNGILMD